MSMNLRCDSVDLWQTPTWITYLAMYDSTGRKRTKKETLHIYIEWVKSRSQGCWVNEDDYKNTVAAE